MFAGVAWLLARRSGRGEQLGDGNAVHFLLDTTDDIFSPMPAIHFNRALSDEEKVTRNTRSLQ